MTAEYYYASNEDIIKSLPPAARNGNSIDSEIDFWKPLAQEQINDLLSPKYTVPLAQAYIPEKVRYAHALWTASLVLVNAYTEYNYESTQNDKTYTLSQTKEWQAKKLIRQFMDERGYYDPNLTETPVSQRIGKVISIFSSDTQDTTDAFISEVNSLYT